MTDHFSDVRARAHDLSFLVKKSKLITFCSAEWPAFQVGWPPEGTFQPSIIQAVKGKIMAPDPWGHPDQVPYVMVWQHLVEDLSKWLKPFVHKPPSSSNSQVLVMKTPSPPWPYVPSLQIPPRREAPTGEPRGLRGPTGTDREGRLALGTRGRTRGDRGGQDPGDPELPSSTVQALPVRMGPANLDGERTYQYWPFSTSDLYNWKTQNPPF